MCALSKQSKLYTYNIMKLQLHRLQRFTSKPKQSKVVRAVELILAR